MKASHGATAVLFFCAAVAFGQENYSDWTNHRNIIINTSSTGANTAGGVGGYPLLVRLTSANFPDFAVAGAKASLRFSQGAKKLPYQIERWDSAGASALVWVSVDTVRGNNATQSIQMHWGRAGAADSSSGAAVFSRARGFVTVHHMGDSAGNTYAPRPNAVQPGVNDARFYPKRTDSAGVANITRPGVIGLADTLRGNGTSNHGTTDANIDARGDHFAFALPGAPQGQPLPAITFAEMGTASLSLWIRPQPSGTGWRHMLTVGHRAATTGNPSYQIWIGRSENNAGNLAGSMQSSDVNETNVVAPGVVTVNEWQYVSHSINGFEMWIYRNGELVGEGFSGYIAGAERTLGFIARSLWSTDSTWRGLVDEVRVHSRQRPAQWHKLDYETQKPASAVLTVGAITAPTGITYSPDSLKATTNLAIAPRFPQGGSVTTITRFTISPALPAGLAFDTLTGGISGTPTAVTALQTHTVTFTNLAGNGTTTVRISVADPVGISSRPFAPSRAFVIRNAGKALASLGIPEGEDAKSLRIAVVDMGGRTVWSRTVGADVRELSWDGRSSQGALVRGICVVRLLSEAPGRETRTIAEAKITLAP